MSVAVLLACSRWAYASDPGATEAAADEPLRDGRALEAAGAYAVALEAYRACASTPGPDQRFCAARQAVLAPQAADGFAGWAVLAAVRTNFRTLGPAAATAQIQSALASDPAGPAAPELRRWLAHELTRQGDAGAPAARAAVIGDPMAPPSSQLALQATERGLRTERRGRAVAVALGLVVLGWAAGVARGWRATPPLAGTTVLVGFALLGAVPAGFALAWGAPGWAWFLATGGAAALGARYAPGLPPWLAAAGPVAGVGLGAWAAGWLPSLGVGG